MTTYIKHMITLPFLIVIESVGNNILSFLNFMNIVDLSRSEKIMFNIVRRHERWYFIFYNNNNEIQDQDIVEIPYNPEIHDDLYRSYFKLYRSHSNIYTNSIFHLVLSNMSSLVNNPLVYRQIGRYGLFQSVHDYDWQYVFKLEHNACQTFRLDLNFMMNGNSIIFIKDLDVRLKNGIEGFYEIHHNDTIINFMIYQSGPDFLYHFYFPCIILQYSDLRELLWRQWVSSKKLLLVCQI